MRDKVVFKKFLGSLLSIAMILSTIFSNVSEVKATTTMITSITSTLDYTKLSSVSIGGTVPVNIIYMVQRKN